MAWAPARRTAASPSPQLGEDVTTSADRPGDLVGDRLEHDHQLAASEFGDDVANCAEHVRDGMTHDAQDRGHPPPQPRR